MPAWLLQILVNVGEWLLPKILFFVESKYPVITQIVAFIQKLLTVAGGPSGADVLAHLQKLMPSPSAPQDHLVGE